MKLKIRIKKLFGLINPCDKNYGDCLVKIKCLNLPYHKRWKIQDTCETFQKYRNRKKCYEKITGFISSGIVLIVLIMFLLILSFFIFIFILGAQRFAGWFL